MERHGADPVDVQAAALLAAGNAEAAFEALFRGHFLKVVALGYRLLRDRDAAGDVAQETFLLVHRGLAGYRGEGRLVAWILKIAVHVALKERRRRTRRPAGGGDALASVAARDTSDPELAERLGRALATLPDEQRVVLSLFAVEGLAHAEIAEVLGVPEGTVWSRLHHARKRLKEALERLR